MIVTELGLVAALTAMALTGPTMVPHVFAAIALGVAFVSASQDIVFDAYRTDVLKPEERGLDCGRSCVGNCDRCDFVFRDWTLVENI